MVAKILTAAPLLLVGDAFYVADVDYVKSFTSDHHQYTFDVKQDQSRTFCFLNANDEFYKNSASVLAQPDLVIWLMYDGEFAHTYTLKRMVETALLANCSIALKDVTKFLLCFGTGDDSFSHGAALLYGNKPIEKYPDVILCRLGAMRCTSYTMSVMRALEKRCVVLNKASAIEFAASKLQTARVLTEHNVATPITAPLRPKDEASRQAVGRWLSYPMVIKTAVGSQGDGVMLIKDSHRLNELCGLLIDNRDYLAQQFIAASAGSDVRVWVVGGKCVAAMQRKAAADAGIRANIHQGGTASNVELSEQLTSVAVAAATALGLDMAGVDLLQHSDGRYFVCEVNAAAGIEAFEGATHVDVASHLIALCKSKVAAAQQARCPHAHAK